MKYRLQRTKRGGCLFKAAIFTVGTEVVNGDIVNTNAAWLASRLHEYGFSVTHHISTSDAESDMKEVLEWLARKVDWVFVAGGLGPTSDDRTRNVVANVIGEELVYSAEVWDQLAESYRARGFAVTEDHKQQCHFPENCTRLENPVGSALGFISELGKTKIVVLPGPPAELKGVFASSVKPGIQDLRLRKAKSATWVCLGITESGAAEKVEETVRAEKLELGYRADIPYVYVKVWIPEGRPEQPILDKINQVIGEYTVATGAGDPAKEETISFFLSADDKQRVCARLQADGNEKAEQLQDPPYHVDLGSPRARRYYAEQALHAWAQMLRTANRLAHSARA